MNGKAKKYLDMVNAPVEDAGTSEGVRKSWESRRRGGGAAGRWNDFSSYRKKDAPSWDSDHFKAAREAHKAHSDFVDELNRRYPGPYGTQLMTSDEIAKQNELSQKWRDAWSEATRGWKTGERIQYLRDNGID